MARSYHITLPEPHPAQQLILDEALAAHSRFNVLDLGRRTGKTVFGTNLAVETVAGGDPCGWFVPAVKYGTEVWEEVLRIFDHAGMVKYKNTTDRRLVAKTGGTFEMWTMQKPEDVARGRKYKRAIVDEAAMVKALMACFQKAIRPTLADLRGDAWFLSTPRGLDGFHTMYQWGRPGAHLRKGWKAWKMPTSANPYILASEIEDMRLSMTERAFMQEILAEFIADGAQVFRQVMDAAVVEPEAVPLVGHKYLCGCDWGRTNDYSVFAILDITSQPKRLVWLDRSTGVEFALQRQRLKALHERYHFKRIIAEKNSMGVPIIEQLQREKLPVEMFETTNATKAAAVDALALAFETRTIQIPRSDATIPGDFGPEPIGETLINELLSYDQERLPSGLIRYGAPEGGHDDAVMATLMVWAGACEPEDGAMEYLRRKVEAMNKAKEQREQEALERAA